MNNSEVLEKLRAYLKCRGRQVKGIYVNCNNKKCDNCDLCYMQGTVGEHIEAVEVATQALEKLKDNESCYRCDSKYTNADRIRNMSDEELLDFICSIETYEEGSVKTIENGVSMHTVTEVRKWLQSEAE